MSPSPSRKTAPELNLDHAPSAGRAPVRSALPATPPPSPRPSSPRPPRRRSPGGVVFFLVILAVVAAGAWWLLRGVGAGVKEEGVELPAETQQSSGGEAADREDPGDTRQPSGGLSRIPVEERPVFEYLRPSTAEVRLWMDSVLASSYIREKWGALAEDMSLVYGSNDDTVNAFAFYDKKDDGRPSIALCGGWVRLARLVGALALVQSSAEAQGVEKDIKAYLRRVSGVVAEKGELTEDDVIDLLNEFKVGTAVFQDVGAVSAAKGFADGVCKATLAHEFGHLAAGHPRGGELNRTVSQNEERQADLFASSIAASIANGQQMLGGQILTWYTLALAETINPTNEIFRSHPYSADRLRAAIESNKSLAASLGISAADVDQLVAEVSAREDAGHAVVSADSGAEAALDGSRESGDTAVASAASASGAADYLHPSENEILALFRQVRDSVAVQGNESYRLFARRIDCSVVNHAIVNACACWERRKSGAIVPVVQYYSGHALFDRVIGAIACKVFFEEDGPENEQATQALFDEFPTAFRNNGFRFTDEMARGLLAKANVTEADLADEDFLKNARLIADGVALSTLSHEIGHFVLGHLGQTGVSLEKLDFNRAQEEQADLFVTQVMAVAPSEDVRRHMFLGRFLWGWSYAYTEAGASDKDSTHPATRRRLRNLIEANPKTAEELGVTVEVVEKVLKRLQPGSDEEESAATPTKSEKTPVAPSSEPSAQLKPQDDKADSSAEGPRRFAVLVGVGHSPVERPLEAPAQNVQMMRTLLVWSAGFDEKDILVLEEEKATSDKVSKAVRDAAASARPGDTFVFYFSGHGGPWGEDKNQTTLCTYSTDPDYDGYTDDALNKDFSLFRKDVNVVAILQACHSGGVMTERGSGRSTEWNPSSFATSVMRLRSELKNAVPVAPIGWITASDASHSSIGNFTGSAFTKSFVGGIHSGLCDANRDGLASFTEAWRFARDVLAEDPENNSFPLCSDTGLCERVSIPIPRREAVGESLIASQQARFSSQGQAVEEPGLKAVAALLAGAKTNETGVCVADAPPFEVVPDSGVSQGKAAIAGGGGLYTEIGTISRTPMAPRPQFQPSSPVRLARTILVAGGMIVTTEGVGTSGFAFAGTIRINGRRYAVYENASACHRLFVSESGELLGVINLVMGTFTVLYDKGDSRRRRMASGLAGGVAFPNVEAVTQWSLSQPIHIDPGKLSSIDFSGGPRFPGGCPVCKGTGQVRRLGPASYGQSHGDNWVSAPCPYCRSGR